jgi:alpha-beta hydrolase superfamily lysophospholipase
LPTDPPAAPRGALIVVHGLGDHAGRYDEFSAYIAARGIATFALDLRGHGRSGGRRGHVARFEIFLDDIDRVRRHVEQRHSGVPLFILGQSMGGLIVLRYLQEYEPPPQGAVICSPWLATMLPVPRWKLLLAPLLAKLAPAFPFRHGIEPERLTRDPALVAAYRADPLVQDRITPATFRGVTRAMRLVRERRDRLRCPLLLLLSGDDRVVDTPTTAAFATGLDGPDVTTELFPGHYHELLNEPDRYATYARIGEWLLHRL